MNLARADSAANATMSAAEPNIALGEYHPL
jgi:hypothetical protein